MKRLLLVMCILTTSAAQAVNTSSQIYAGKDQAFDKFYEEYAINFPLYGINNVSVTSNWVQVEKKERFSFNDPSVLAKKRALEQLKSRSKNKENLETVIEFETKTECTKNSTYNKVEINSSTYESNNGFTAASASASSTSSVSAARASVFAASGYSYSSGSSTSHIERDTYCSEMSTFVRATVKATLALRNKLSPDLIKYYINQHSRGQTRALIASLNIFMNQLTQLEMDPYLDNSKIMNYEFKTPEKMTSWMNYYLTQIKGAAKYARFLTNARGNQPWMIVDNAVDELNGTIESVLIKLADLTSSKGLIVAYGSQNKGEVSLSTLTLISAKRLDDYFLNYSTLGKPDLRKVDLVTAAGSQKFKSAKDAEYIENVYCPSEFQKIADLPRTVSSLSINKVSAMRELSKKCGFKLSKTSPNSNGEIRDSEVDLAIFNRSSGCAPYGLDNNVTETCQTGYGWAQCSAYSILYICK